MHGRSVNRRASRVGESVDSDQATGFVRVAQTAITSVSTVTESKHRLDGMRTLSYAVVRLGNLPTLHHSSIALSLTELSRKSSIEPSQRKQVESTANGHFLLLTSGALVFIVLPPDGQKLGNRASVDPSCAPAVWLEGENIMASKNHPESIASDAACGVGWIIGGDSVRSVDAAAGPSQTARSATIVSLEDPEALGSLVESELKRKS